MVSTLMVLSFLALAVSGLILFISPPGRVANWTDWQMLGMTKHMWGSLHIWFATLFLGITCFHLYYNWRPLISYLKKRRGQNSGIRLEWVSSVAVAFILFLGTSMAVPPFVSFIDWQESIKESWEDPAQRAPIPHAELLTVAELAELAKIDTQTALERLAVAGITDATAETVTSDIAAKNKVSAQAVYNILDPVRKGAGPGYTGNANGTSPVHGDGEARGAIGGGMGWKTLAQFCEFEGIPLQTALDRLGAEGITAKESDTLRAIAQQAGYDRPYIILEVMRGTKSE